MSIQLNQNEKAVFISLGQEILNCTGGQFGYAPDADIPEGMTKNQFKGYISQLTKKGLFDISFDEYKQLTVGENFKEFAEANDLFIGKSFEIGWDSIFIESSNNNSGAENTDMSKTITPALTPEATKIIGAFDQYEGFYSAVSINGRVLIEAFRTGKKTEDNLSKRDSGTWNAVQKIYQTWLKDFEATREKFSENHLEETDDDPMVYKLEKGEIVTLSLANAVKALIPAYVEKSARKILGKGKSVLTKDDISYCGTIEPLQALKNPSADLVSEEIIQDDEDSEVQESAEVETEYDLNEIESVTGEIVNSQVHFVGQNAVIISRLLGIELTRISGENEDFASFPKSELPRYMKVIETADINLLIKEDESEESEESENIIDAELSDEEIIPEAPKPEVSDDDDIQDISIPSDVNFAEMETQALATVEKAIDAEANDILGAITIEDDFSDLEELTAQDVEDLERLESEISEELPNWEKANDFLGQRFNEINRRKLYRKTHKSFPKYVLEKFGVTRAKAYQLIISAEVRQAISSGVIEGEMPMLPSQRASQTINQISQSFKGMLEDNHSVREIENYDRQLHKFVWEITIRSAPKDASGNPIISPAHLESVKETVKRITETKTVNIDGQDVPLDLVSQFADASITEETHERNERQKEKIVNDIKKAKERKSSPQERVLTNPSDSKESGAKFGLNIACDCGQAGCDSVKKFVFGGIVMNCNHGFIKVQGKDKLVFTDIIE